MTHYSATVTYVGENGDDTYGFRVLGSGEVEYFGDYAPSDKTRELHRILGTALAKQFPPPLNADQISLARTAPEPVEAAGSRPAIDTKRKEA